MTWAWVDKTITTLTAINNLIYDLFEVKKVLIIAPLRVARDTWSAEVQKWDHLKHLRYSVAVGTAEERIAALNADADIYIINRENVDWLVSNTKFDYDMLVIDEISSFKNHQSKRFKALMKIRPKVKRIVGLTGTPASNGLMDLFAEFKLLDMGERLGRFIGQYRNEYFKPDKQNGYVVYSYKPLPDAEERIYDKISDITVSMKAVDHLKMPELVSTESIVKMSDAEKEKYKELKDELILEVQDTEITAANAAALSNKLCQMSNGAIYDDENNIIPIHSRKLDALEDMIESANGKPVLVAYWFKHDRTRITERLGETWNCLSGNQVGTKHQKLEQRKAAGGINSPCICRTRFELTGRRKLLSVVWTDLEFGTLSTDQCKTLATGTTVRNGSDTAYRHQRHSR